MSHPTSRRAFLGSCGSAVLAMLSIKAIAAAPASLDVNDPTAKALGYVPDASKLKPGQEASFKAGSHCGSCALYVKAQETSGHAPCGAFAGKLVANKGWCRAYAAG